MNTRKTIARTILSAMPSKKSAAKKLPIVKYRRIDGDIEYGRIVMRAQGHGNYVIKPLSDGIAEVVYSSDIIAIV
jgi:hypothetical protein